MTGRLVVGITGASGSIYAIRFLRHAVRHFEQVYVAVSDQAAQVMEQELCLEFDPAKPRAEVLLGQPSDRITFVDRKDYFTPPASGSFRHDGMVIVPCSMGSAGRIANGVSDDLVSRAADVCLKERRPLILVVRESPLNLIHLRNLTQLTEAGAVILPASPGFYHRPSNIEELVDSVVARILQQLGIEQKVMPEWQHPDPR